MRQYGRWQSAEIVDDALARAGRTMVTTRRGFSFRCSGALSPHDPRSSLRGADDSSALAAAYWCPAPPLHPDHRSREHLATNDVLAVALINGLRANLEVRVTAG